MLAVLGAALALAYGAYLQPEWDPGRNDQVQYLALARGLAERGEFTRATASEPFIPESIRFPGYPLFLAPLCLFGCSPWVVTAAQAIVLAGLVLLVARSARELVGPRGARVAAGLVALHPAFAFFAAHALSDLLGAALTMASVAATVRLAARPSVPTGIGVGLLSAAMTLVRPLQVIVTPLVATLVARRVGTRSVVLPLALAAIAFVLTIAPYVGYVQTYFGRPLAGNSGAQLWLGYFQGLAPADFDETENAEVAAARGSLSRFDAITDRLAQPRAFVALDDELRSRALGLIAHDPIHWVLRSGYRSVVLWGGDVPARLEGSSGLLAAVWAGANLVLLGVGLVGAVRLARRGDALSAVPLALIVATWAFSLPLWAEGRYSLPARPFVAIGAAAFAEDLLRRRDRT